MTRYTILVISVVFLLVACGKKDDKKKQPAGNDKKGSTADKKPIDEKPAGPDFSKWDTASKQKAWQGSWLVKENGKIQAWTVDGTKVSSWDGAKDETFELIMAAPCRARFKNDQGMSFPRNFTVVDGTIQYRGMGAGYRDGGEAIFCDGSGAIYLVDAAGKCTVWEDKFREWESKNGECGIKKNAEGVEVFHHADPNRGEFEIKGGAILSKASFPTEKVDGDHAAAKAARDAKAAK